MLYETYFDMNIETTYKLVGIFMMLVTVFGIVLSIRLKRTKLFRFKLMFIYVIPAIVGFTLFMPHGVISHTYQYLLICAFIALSQILYYREVCDEVTNIGYYKTFLPDFLNIVPDMVWMKDLDHKFIYTNDALRDGLLKCTEQEAFGKTGIELAKVQQAKGHEYTFGDICGDTDIEVMKRSSASRFLEFGTVNGKFLALQVFKAPVYKTLHDGKRECIGTIGMGRDLTYDFVDHEKIAYSLKHGTLEETKEIFKKHQSRYLFTGISIVRDRDNKTEYTRRWYDNGVFARRWYDNHEYSEGAFNKEDDKVEGLEQGKE